MNINTQPLIQEELLDTRLESLRDDAHNLIRQYEMTSQ